MSFSLWASQFPNGQTYILFLIPNLLSQAIVLNRYLARIEVYQEQGNDTGIYFEYAKIFRKIFVFDMPDFDEDLDDLPGRDDDGNPLVGSSSLNTLQWLASTPFRWASKLLSLVVTTDGSGSTPRVGSAPPRLKFSITDKNRTYHNSTFEQEAVKREAKNESKKAILEEEDFEEGFDLYTVHGKTLLKAVLAYQKRTGARLERMASLFLDGW